MCGAAARVLRVLYLPVPIAGNADGCCECAAPEKEEADSGPIVVDFRKLSCLPLDSDGPGKRSLEALYHARSRHEGGEGMFWW